MLSLYNLVGFIDIKFYRIKTIFWYKLFFKKIGLSSIIMKPLHLTPESIVVGKRVFIWKNARIEGVKKYQSESFSPQIIINDGVSIQQNIHLTCAEFVEIGKNTAIAANVSITDIHHPYDNIDMPIEHQNIKTKPVFIGENCKIYNNSVIMQGTSIGNHCTIGANSVVSGKFDNYCVIVGAPARVIKRYCFEKHAWLKTDSLGTFIK